MKRCKLLALLILVCLLMLPVFATAETQGEFELRCFKKTAAAATVYSYLNSSEGEVMTIFRRVRMYNTRVLPRMAEQL